MFNANLVYHEVDWFYNLGLQKYYFERFAASQRSLITSTHSSQPRRSQPPPDALRTSSCPLSRQSVDGSPVWLYMCPIEHDRQVEVEKRVQSQIMKISLPSQRKSYTLEFFMSLRPIMPSGSKQMGLYVLESSEWNNPQYGREGH